MLGYGLDRNVVDAYAWLVENYEDGVLISTES
jgi:uncharacterized protein (DUF2235 family)